MRAHVLYFPVVFPFPTSVGAVSRRVHNVTLFWQLLFGDVLPSSEVRKNVFKMFLSLFRRLQFCIESAVMIAFEVQRSIQYLA